MSVVGVPALADPVAASHPACPPPMTITGWCLDDSSFLCRSALIDICRLRQTDRASRENIVVSFLIQNNASHLISRRASSKPIRYNCTC